MVGADVQKKQHKYAADKHTQREKPLSQLRLRGLHKTIVRNKIAEIPQSGREFSLGP